MPLGTPPLRPPLPYCFPPFLTPLRWLAESRKFRLRPGGTSTTNGTCDLTASSRGDTIAATFMPI